MVLLYLRIYNILINLLSILYIKCLKLNCYFKGVGIKQIIGHKGIQYFMS